MTQEYLEKPLWQLTVGEFLELQGKKEEPQESIDTTDKKYVYGLSGIADLFGCSLPTAQRIKNSGRINKAISQVGRKIIVDAELALKLNKKK